MLTAPAGIGAGVGILDEERDGFIRAGRGQAGVEVGRPGVGVMVAGQRAALGAIGVERVFNDVMAGDPERVHKQRAAEVAEAEALAHRAAVDGKQRAGPAEALAPGRERGARRVKQMQVQLRLGRAVQAPVIGHGDAGVQRAGPARRDIAQQRIVGREIERIQIAPGVGEHVIGQPHGVQGDDLHAGGDQVMQRGELGVPVEREHEQRLCLQRADLTHGRGLLAPVCAPEVFDALHKVGVDSAGAQVIKRAEVADRRGRVKHGQRLGSREPLDQPPGRPDRGRMAQRLKQRLAAGVVAGPPARAEIRVLEGVDCQCHGWCPPCFIRPC